ncbi:DUF305 domain-containing protein [Streptomyces sp. AK02-01A]|uniref:DUF305 domain-containing protein n=1 Tax=Streptomyces sp. AK02-01A TaxID=3028648 RepID=UPI0029B45A99|nr:DUF305 domain-containing protein [Streptomyces sp. AK02-01A]MDX3855243.1 DUF305 domain-containing protein [Streptomyces sp. AK02-01A]
MTAHRLAARRSTVAATVAGAALLLAACGGNGTGPATHSGHGASTSASAPAAASAHNSADASFARGMIPHHRQALRMAGLAAGRASSTEVRSLATKITQAQDSEIKAMSGWLRTWGEPVPADGGSGHSGHSMPGMMSDDDMAALEKVSGAAFDTAFLDLMVKHHEGAVAMARTETARGANEDAKRTADGIIASQTTEITRMNTLRRE